MKKDRLSIYISSPDSYADVLKIFFKGFRKYWSDCPYEFILATNTKSYEGITCIKNNKQGDTWVGRTLEALPNIRTKYVMVMCDDVIITGKVDGVAIERVLDYMDDHAIRYCRLFPTKPTGPNIESFPLLCRVNKQVAYAINFRLGIFRKDFIAELLGDGSLSAWELENFINKQAAAADNENFEDVVAVSNCIVPYIHSVYKGRWIRKAVSALSEKGLYENGSNRPLVTFTQNMKICTTEWAIRKIKPAHRRKLKSLLAVFGVKFATKY